MSKVDALKLNQPKTNSTNITLAAAAGAAAGLGVRYVAPTSEQVSSIFNKNNVDKFFSSTAMQARSNRSFIKYAGIGALITTTLALIKKAINEKKAQIALSKEYSQYQAIIQGPDSACEVLWYEA